MGGTGRAAGGAGIKKSENKGLLVCWNKGNKMVWLEMSDCLLESGWQGCWAYWENCRKGCLILNKGCQSILNLQYAILCNGH